ncbi:MAG TPA: UdgX family uracil-DNA binding protein [Chthoniobacteraceae bacterium]|nr:UdgX family uracil-DNA binding protein [Chthoniobacteraceae bacterium]
MTPLRFLPTFDGWRTVARDALQQGLLPDQVTWDAEGDDAPPLEFGGDLLPAPSFEPKRTVRVPREFMQWAARIVCHRAPERWAVLYHVLWRLTHGEPHLLRIVVDPQVHRLLEWDKAVRRDVHKMRAFVRFREVRDTDPPSYVAWFEPQHHIVELNAPFFVDRFAAMRWSILTPERCAHWDGQALTFTPGVSRPGGLQDAEMEELWRTYYAHIFNPARVKIHAMQNEMPKHYWKNLPEAALIPSLIREAPARVERMIELSDMKRLDPSLYKEAPVPATDDWEVVRRAALKCTACPLYRLGTQTVFGEGPRDADIVFLGEQPGDQEDREGRPFIGPAGQLLDRALVEAGVNRERCYVTNAVKHFKWEPRGKRRIHQKPDTAEIGACKPWWKAELALIKPRRLVCLGGTAARAVFGRVVKVTQERGSFVETEFASETLITVHPSSLLRAPDPAARERDYALFVRDLALLVAER